MTWIVRFSTIVLLGILILSLPASATNRKKRRQNQYNSQFMTTLHAPDQVEQGGSRVRAYLKNDLDIENLEKVDLTFAKQRMLKRISEAKAEDPAFIKEILEGYFSPVSKRALLELFHSFILTDYNNRTVLAPAGSGKSFLLDQLVAMYSFGIIPDFLLEDLGMTGTGETYKMFREQLFGKTDVIAINMSLLSADPTENGKAFSSETVRMRKILSDLFTRAREQFEHGGRRTLFIVDEAATLPDLVQETLKKILDDGGFSDPSDEVLRVKDPGFMVLNITTAEEYQRMIKGDPAIERRAPPFYLDPPNEKQAFDIVRKRVDKVWSKLYKVQMADEAIWQIIRYRKVLFNPPLEMPASVLRATNLIMARAREHMQNGTPINARTVQKFIMENVGLTAVCFEGPNGEPPGWNLAELWKKEVIGQDELIDKMAPQVVRWLRFGFGSEAPTFFILGKKGTGKDTLMKGLSKVLLGHTSEHLMWSLAGAEDFKIESIIEGPPIGNHSDNRPPLYIAAINRGPRTGIFTLNEAKDAPSEQLEKLKVPLERGKITPAGIESRPFELLFPTFIMGQWGEELFEGKTDAEVDAIYDSLTQYDLEEILLKGKAPGIGAVPPALIDRAKGSGGLYMVKPPAKKHYPAIAELQLRGKAEKLKTVKGIELTVSKELLEYVGLVADKTGEGPRGLNAILVDFTESALSAAIDKGMPLYHTAPEITVEQNDDWRDAVIVVKNGERSWSFQASSLYRGKTFCERVATEYEIPKRN